MLREVVRKCLFCGAISITILSFLSSSQEASLPTSGHEVSQGESAWFKKNQSIITTPSINKGKTSFTPKRRNNERITLPLAPPLAIFFVGRRHLLSQLKATYNNKEQCVVQLLTGAGGLGKTQIALKFYHAVKPEYDYAFWIPAASKEELIGAYLEIAEALGIYVNTQQIEQTIQEVRTYLASLNCFYVFDNAPDSKLIKEFLPLQRGHILITSRNNLANAWKYSTKRVLVTPLDSKEIIALAREFECLLEDEDTTTLNYLIERLSGYPLAVAQFFSLCKTQGYHPAEFVTELQKRPSPLQESEIVQLLATEPTGDIEYDRSVLQMLDISLQQLDKVTYGENARKLLSLFAYLDPKGIPVDWICTFLSEDNSFLKRQTRTALALLEQYSLVQWDRERKQVYIHEVIQQVVRHLHPQPSLKDLVSSLLEYGDRETDVTKNEAEQYTNLWLSLLPHGRMLFNRINKTECLQEAYSLAKFLAKICRVRFFKEALTWSQETLSITQKQYTNQDRPEIAYAWDSLGLAWRKLGKQEIGLKHYMQGLAMRKRLFQDQDHPDMSYSINTIGYTLLELGRLKEGLVYCEEGLAMRKRLYSNQNHPEIAISLICTGECLLELGDLDKGLSYLKQALLIQQQIYKNGDRHYTAYALNKIGYALMRIGKVKEGLAHCEQGLAMRQRLYHNQGHQYIAYSLDCAGRILEHTGKLEEGATYLKEALAIRQRIYKGYDHPNTAISLNHMGHAWMQIGKLEKGLTYIRHGLNMNKRIHSDKDHPAAAHSLDNMGKCLRKLGKLEEGMAYIKQGLAMNQRLYKDQDHYYTASSLDNLGHTLMLSGNLEKGASYIEESLAMRQRLYKNKDHTETANSLLHMGQLLVRSEKLEAGTVYLKQALDMQQRIFKDQDHPSTATMLTHMGHALMKARKPEEGTAYLKQALDMQQRIFKDQDHHETATMLTHMGHALVLTEKLEEGIACLRQAVDMQQRIFRNKDHPGTAVTLSYMGHALMQIGKLEEGTACIEQAYNIKQRIFMDHNPF